ncbi:ankyrin-1-like [Ylistrum balloti]|uniref:ankyrin-1-like n=1 Tax=Ylistrum balloti TaxID=509963 RepID=UPI002905CF1A|nr:ankyrin-1-like [Ylistrum balloti]
MRKSFHRKLAKVACCTKKSMAKADILNKAIIGGDEDVVRSLISEGADVDHLLGMRGTALCAAIGAKQSSIALLLIESGSGVNIEDWDREPPLHLAIRKGCLDIARTLIYHPKCNLDKADPLTKTPAFCYAAEKGIADVVKWMIQAGCNTLVKNAYDNTALHLAVKGGHLEVVRQLVKSGVNCHFNEMGLAPVHLAAQAGDVTVFLLLLSEWINPHSGNVDDIIIPSSARKPVKDFVNLPKKYSSCSVTPIEYAVMGRHVDMVKFLLRCGAYPNPDKNALKFANNLPPLLRACTFYIDGILDIDMAEHLINAGADTELGGKLMTATFGSRPVTPLQYAAKKNSVKLAEFLVKHGADVNNINQSEAPLFVALTNGSLEVAWYFMKECKSQDFQVLDIKSRNLLHSLASLISVKEIDELVSFLINNGCNVDNSECQNADGVCTPIHTAILEQNTILLDALITHGANVNAKSRGLAPLHQCALNGDVAMANMLLLSGADIDLVSDNGQSALAMALECDSEEHTLVANFFLDNDCFVHSDLVGDVDDEALSDSQDSGSDSDSYDDDEMEGTRLKNSVQTRVNALALVPRTLVQFCMLSIRQHFISKKLKFCTISNLPLPTKIKDRLSYKTETENGADSSYHYTNGDVKLEECIDSASSDVDPGEASDEDTVDPRERTTGDSNTKIEQVDKRKGYQRVRYIKIEQRPSTAELDWKNLDKKLTKLGPSECVVHSLSDRDLSDQARALTVRDPEFNVDENQNTSKEDTTFAGRRDVLSPGSIKERPIVSRRGSVRGLKNRVKAGIATFLNHDGNNQTYTTEENSIILWRKIEKKTKQKIANKQTEKGRYNYRNYSQLEKGKIVIYTSSMAIVRETYERCILAKKILQTHMVRYEEKDLFMSVENQRELRERLGVDEVVLPQVFADGVALGGMQQLEDLNEEGELRKLLSNFTKINVRSSCEKCGGYRYVPCTFCHGSKKSLKRNYFTEEFSALRCMQCDENGLLRCDMCLDQQE